ncbi:MAG: molybdenum cofactor guanylyltransferase MobA [Betaproteobacteria bacterium RIFCSPLOWO2_12_FULL_65_14]|nr:MAG: molybdenum cofactor guanylyltransferase MobA [Betaproteobacteria bacterium RIFCSPLOWO2_12_FULL_65_14]
MNGVSGIVLAGGQGRRMGGIDKGLQPLRGKPMVQWAIERLAAQVDELLINCNQNLEAYARFGYRVVPDEIGGFAGPLAGLHAGLKAAAQPLVVTVPCDSPFLPHDLVRRLQERIGTHEVAVARTGDRAHPVFSLVRKDVLENLERFLLGGGRKVDTWYATLRSIEVSFDDEADAFLNINTLEELGRT